MRGKRFFLGLCFLIGLVVLTACQNQKISNLQNQYHADGMATVVKGSTKAKSVQYRIDQQAWQSAKVNGGTFVVTVPISNQSQKLTFKTDTDRQQATISKSTPVMAFAKFGMIYAAATQQNPNAIKIQPELLRRANYNGVIGQNNGTQIRAVVADQQLMGLTVIAQTATLKKAQNLNQFGSTLGTLAGVSGADAKTVLTKFEAAVKSAKKGKTTINTIKSKDINFDVAFSNDELFIYMTHQ
ncbi:hypothetical protein FC83_GL002446 [Agrilactobacillus composti DSM 18527 = JCM 14202]|uniref:Lipoprotein n=1 Tax=Agrilactobacillus composti DSM 18527 = JCM 14202 TaxID=1423734 RepID=A0A0R1Y2L4_9LACO|nr:hypothetical protein [Agrilactobacillus composti]KRM36574.1 hypothetical protein FC83_GL002446 [Agrilactobacillus composti DSM 18527 = JCM 14202]